MEDSLKKKILEDYHKVKGTTIQMHQMLGLVHTVIFQDVTKNVIIKGDKRSFEHIPAHKTLFKIPKNRGLPIGNLTSQFFANVYMNDFDNFVKRELKCKRYIRYVDDFVLFSESKSELLKNYTKIKAYLQRELKLTLRDRYLLKNNNEGLNFLGYVIKPHYTLVRKRVVNNFKFKKVNFLERYEYMRGKMDLLEIKQFLSVKASFVGHCNHANSYNLINKVGNIDEKDPFSFDKY